MRGVKKVITKYGELMLKAQRDNNLLLSVMLSLKAAQIGNPKIVNDVDDIVTRVTNRCAEINTFLNEEGVKK